jgi:hypothetical protein
VLGTSRSAQKKECPHSQEVNSLVGTTRNTQFGTRDPLLLTSHAFQTKDVHTFIQYIYQLIRAEAFDETVLEKLTDDEAMGVLTLLFKTSEVSIVSPAPNGSGTWRPLLKN